MCERVLLDNDVLIKMSAWQLGGPLTECLTTASGPPAMLGLAAFVIKRKLRRIGLQDHAAAETAFTSLCETLLLVEPTEQELETAAATLAKASSPLSFCTGTLRCWPQVISVQLPRWLRSHPMSWRAASHLLNRCCAISGRGLASCNCVLISATNPVPTGLPRFASLAIVRGPFRRRKSMPVLRAILVTSLRSQKNS
jgi:hypothetical protein